MPSDEVARLADLARKAAASVPDIPKQLAEVIRLASDGQTDPWLLAGVLVEGLAHVIHTAIPGEQRQECAAAAVQMLAQRTGLWRG